MSVDTITKGVTAIVAIYGAMLSTYTLMARFRDQAKRIRVTLSTGFVGRGPNLSEAQLFFKAANVGSRNVTLVSFCIRLPDGKQIVLRQLKTDPPFPCQVSDGNKCECWEGVKVIAQGLIQAGYSKTVSIRAEFRDAADNRFRSKKFKFPVEGWLKEGG